MQTHPAPTIGPCPHCGVEDDVFVNIRAFGWAQEYFGVTGAYESLDIDDVEYTNSTTIRCASCKGIRRDLEFTDTIPRSIKRK